MYTFGGNSFGSLGHGNRNDLSVPTLVKGLIENPIAHIACGMKRRRRKKKRRKKKKKKEENKRNKITFLTAFYRW